MLERISIQMPFEGHVHFRENEVMRAVAPYTAKHFWGAIVMPNTDPPMTTIAQTVAYRRDIEDATKAVNPDFMPLVGLYLTENLDPEEVRLAYTKPVQTRLNLPRRGAEFLKYYPKGGTTNSKHGVVDIMKCAKVLEVAEKIGMPVCLHGEKVLKPSGCTIDHLDRERYFVEGPLEEVLKNFPALNVCLEHISTKEGIERVSDDESGRLRASITRHHAMFTHADLFEGGMWPDLNQMPTYKHEPDRRAIRSAMFSGDRRFYAGSDSAPHPASKKYSSCCPFGVFSAPGLLEGYATVWSEAGKLETAEDVVRFNNFMSVNGPRFYGFLPSPKTIDLVREEWTIDEPVHVQYEAKADGTEARSELYYPLGAHPGRTIPFKWKVVT